jgi:hypothetical protein
LLLLFVGAKLWHRLKWFVNRVVRRIFVPKRAEVGARIAQPVWRLGYGLADRGSTVGRCWEFSSSPPCPYQLWGPLSLLSNAYRGFFSRWQTCRGVKLTYDLHLAPRLRMCGVIFPPPPFVFIAWCLLKYVLNGRKWQDQIKDDDIAGHAPRMGR